MVLKLLWVLFFTSISFAQINDTISVISKTNTDSLNNYTDSLSLKDSSFVMVKDSIVPLYSVPLSDGSYIISNKSILQSEYRYSGDYLRLFSFNFIKDLGYPGQPNETFLYGVGNGGVSYLLDGISYNHRDGNSFNLNLLQSEDVDSIEILHLPRGFLYGAYNNPVSVNFITKDMLPQQPYSRIRYYQGPNRESLIDGIFNLRITKRFSTSFELTNRIVDSTYANSEFSIWQGKIKLKYLLSNKVNIIASYRYNDYKAGYSGGIDVDSIISTTSDVESIMYDYNRAPVIYPNGELKIKTNLTKLRVLASPFTWLNMDASAYYLIDEYEKNDYRKNYSEGKTYGINILNSAKYDLFNIQLNLGYEKREISATIASKDSANQPTPNISLNDYSINNLYLSIILSTNISDIIVPSIFYKASLYDLTSNQRPELNEDYDGHGIGADISLKTKLNLDFYFGASVLTHYKSDESNSGLVEAGARYSNDFISADLKYFINQFSYGFYTGGIFYDHIKFGDLSGFGLNLKLNYWRLLLESNSSYYVADDSELNGVPEFQTQTGLYFYGDLFNNNLALKSGFVIYFVSDNNVYTNEHGLLTVPSSYKLDFTLAGEIQKVAIVYFLWQNLLGNDYYITPYYPMPDRSIRFGIAWELFN